MFLIILVTFNYFVNVATTENAVMIFKVKQISYLKFDCTLEYRPVLLEDEPVQIYVKNNDYIDNGKCSSADSRNIPFSKKNYNFKEFVVTIEQLESSTGNVWSCNFFKSSWSISIVHCKAKFHLRTKKPVASISLNNNEVLVTRTPGSVTNYDAEGVYLFYDGETVDIECTTSPSHVKANSQSWITFSNSTVETLIQTSDVYKKESIIMKLSKNDDSNYVECFSSHVVDDIFVTRLVFQLQKEITTKSVINIYINGMYVRAAGSLYEYVYHDEEQTNITCELLNGGEAVLTMDYDGNIVESDQFKVSTTLYVSYKTDVVCSANGSNIFETVRIKFIASSSDFYINGLNKGNILKQYRETEHKTVIYYEFTGSELLTLTCRKKDETGSRKLKWIFNKITMHSIGRTYHNKIYRNLTHQLQITDGNSTLECVYQDENAWSKPRQIIINLIYREPSHTDVTNSTGIPVLKYTNTYWLWSSVAVGTVIVIFVIIILITKSMKPTRKKRQSSDTQCLNTDNNDPLPHPEQWNESNTYRESINDEPRYENSLNLNKKRRVTNDIDTGYANVEFMNQAVLPALNYADIAFEGGKLFINNDKVAYSHINFDSGKSDGEYVNSQYNSGNLDRAYVNCSGQGPSYVNSHVCTDQESPYSEVQVRSRVE